jgi:hypothetical protein
MAEQDLFFNGIDGASGLPIDNPTTTNEFGDLIIGTQYGGHDIVELAFRLHESHLGVAYGTDSERLNQTGWAVVGSEDTSGKVLSELRPLLDLRREQAGDRFFKFFGLDGFRAGDTKRTFLQRHGVGVGSPANPDKMPYYLLLIGGPSSIPFDFQYQMAAEYAVGRIDFDDLRDYRSYAERVCECENEGGSSQPSVTLFGPSNQDDRSTQLSAAHLVEPLRDRLVTEIRDSRLSFVPPAMATKEALLDLLSTDMDLLFTASHGIAFPPSDRSQSSQQGALLCQDWPGPKRWTGRLDPSFFVSAADAERLASISTRVIVAFACYAAGTPRLDEYPRRSNIPARIIADRPFVARLPKQLLSHPGGGALGFVGHVDRTWGSSFLMSGGERQVEVFQSAVRAIVDGARLGNATRYFGLRYLALGGELTNLLDEVRRSGAPPDRVQLSRLWMETNDARGLVVLGDPAVRARQPEVLGLHSDSGAIWGARPPAGRGDG